MSPTNIKVFISYRRGDLHGHGSGLVGRIYDRLSQHYGTENVFLDVDTIPPGIDFAEYLRAAFEQADVLLAVIGPDWISLLRERQQVDNDFVRSEIEQALERAIPVIPLLIGKTPMPKAIDLPDSRNLVGKEKETTQAVYLGTVIPKTEGEIVLQIREEKDEISYIDELHISIKEQSKLIPVKETSFGSDLLQNRDGKYLVLTKGEILEVRFHDPRFSEGKEIPLVVSATGYYDPVRTPYK